MFEQTLKNIDDILWKEGGGSNALDYVEQTSWIRTIKDAFCVMNVNAKDLNKLFTELQKTLYAA